MIILPENFQENDLRNQLENILKTKSHKENVLFALNCAKDVKHLYNSEKVNLCIDLTEQWLVDPNSVSNEQLANAAIAVSISSVYFATSAAIHANSVNNAANAVSYAASYAANASANASYSAANDYKNYMKFYIIEANLKLKPNSEQISPCFDLQNQEEFLIALDFIQEFYYDDLLIQENNLIFFKFYDFLKANSLPELIKSIFNNNTYKNQITRIISKLLELSLNY